MHQVFSQVLVFILGLCLGSFINVVIYRLPKSGLSLGRPRRSFCPACGASIAWYDNLPLVSYFILRGRCRHCHDRISFRYPLVELIAGVLTLAVFLKSGFSLSVLPGLYLVLALLAITFIDLDEMIIPDAITLPGMGVALGFSVLSPDIGLAGPKFAGMLMGWGVSRLWLISLIGSFSGLILGGGLIWIIFQAYYLWRKEEGIGGGDFTLLAMIGAFLGWRAVFMTIFFGSISGLLAAMIAALFRGEFSGRARIPFGPFLSLAALIYLFFGEIILTWYLG